jgi:hypothetical protein
MFVVAHRPLQSVLGSCEYIILLKKHKRGYSVTVRAGAGLNTARDLFHGGPQDSGTRLLPNPFRQHKKITPLTASKLLSLTQKQQNTGKLTTCGYRSRTRYTVLVSRPTHDSVPLYLTLIPIPAIW